MKVEFILKSTQKLVIFLLSIATVLFTSNTALYAATLHVGSAKGRRASDDSYSDLQRAIDAAVKIKAENKREPIEIIIEPGTYRIAAPVKIPSELSGTEESPTIIKALTPESVWISGFAILPSARKATSKEKRHFDPSVRKKIYVYDLQEKLKINPLIEHGSISPPTPGPSELLINSQLGNLSRWPQFGFVKLSSFQSEKIMLENMPDSGLTELSQIWALGYWENDYFVSYIPVKKIRNELVASGKEKIKAKANQRVAILNTVAGMRKHNDYIIDELAGKVYVVSDNYPAGSEIMQAKNLLEINSVKNLRISNVNFQGAMSIAVNAIDVDNFKIDGATIRYIGESGVKIYGRSSGIYNSKLYSIGETAISLVGGDRQSLSPGHLFSENNEVSDFGRWVRTYRPGVLIAGVGNQVSDNKISDAPHAAIMLSGNDHTIMRNEIFDVVKEAGDAGAIYMGRDWSMRGTKIAENYLHDIWHSEINTNGIYLDDQYCGVNIEKNTFRKVRNPIFIGGGRDNHVIANHFIDSGSALRIDSRGLNWQKAMVADVAKGFLSKLNAVPYMSKQYSKYEHLSSILSDEPGRSKYNTFEGNEVIGGKCAVYLDMESVKGIILTNNRCVEEIISGAVSGEINE